MNKKGETSIIIAVLIIVAFLLWLYIHTRSEYNILTEQNKSDNSIIIKRIADNLSTIENKKFIIQTIIPITKIYIEDRDQKNIEGSVNGSVIMFGLYGDLNGKYTDKSSKYKGLKSERTLKITYLDGGQSKGITLSFDDPRVSIVEDKSKKEYSFNVYFTENDLNNYLLKNLKFSDHSNKIRDEYKDDTFVAPIILQYVKNYKFFKNKDNNDLIDPEWKFSKLHVEKDIDIYDGSIVITVPDLNKLFGEKILDHE